MSFTAETKTEISRLRDQIARGTKIISISGLTSIAAKAFVLSELQREIRKTFVVVADSNKDLENWECDLDFFNSRFKVQDSRFKVRRPKNKT